MKKQICKIWSVILAAMLCMALFQISALADETTTVAAEIPVTVTVSGEDIPDETYTFTLTAVDSAPMPASDTLTIDGPGSGSFTIEYQTVGVYQYTLTQDASALSGDNSTCDNRGTYGTTVYYVTVTVQNTDDGIVPTVAIHKGSTSGVKCEAAEFENSYVAMDPSLSVVKTALVEEGYKAAAGDTISYTIQVTNDGNVTISGITVTDDLTGENWTVGELKPGSSSEVYETSYVVTEDDVIAGSVTNVATATGKDPDGDPVEGSDSEDVLTEEANAILTVTKTAVGAPENGEAYVLGETINYEITVTNDGNLTITDITVTDELTGNTGDDAWTIVSLAPGESKTFTASYVVTEADILAGSVVNEATAAGEDPNGDPVDGNDSEEELTEDPKGHLTVTKTATSEPENGEAYVLGEKIDYEITVTNDGNLTITDITVTDELTGNTGDDAWTIVSLAPGESKTFTASYVVTEADILAGSVKNVATASGTSQDPEEPEVPVEPGEDEEPTEDPKGHLTVTKEATSDPANGATYALGETITYKITVTNDGNLTITDITVTDELTGNTGENAWTIDSLAPGESETFEASYTVTEKDILAGSVKNVATASGTSPDSNEPEVPVEPGEDEEPTEDPKGHLTVTKTATSEPENGATYALGETITYKITVTNDGNLTITDITVTDELTDNTGENAWTIDSLAPGESQTFEASYTVTEKDILAGSVVNEATASGTSPDPDEPEVPVEPGEDKEPTETSQPSLYVQKTALVEDGYKAKAGDTISYEIEVINNGNVTISGITVSDSLTSESWTIEALEPNAIKTFTTSYVVTESDVISGSVVNTATASGTDPDDKPVGDEDEETVPTVDPNGHLKVTKTTTSKPANGVAYALGETITYQIAVKNNGNLTITNITVTDELTGNTGTNAWTIASLAPGESKTFTASYVVTEADIIAGSVKNVATASGTSPDPDEPNVPVVPGEDEEPTETLQHSLYVKKTALVEEDYKAAAGDTISYEIEVINNGNVTVSDITVTDDLTGEKWAIDILEPNASQTFTTSYVVTEADVVAGSVKNVATASGVDPNGDPVDGSGSEEVPTIEKNAHLTVSKTVTSEPANGVTYALGETITYQITVTNDGNLTITDITVTDELTGNTGENAWTIASLAPGESQTFTASYVVTEADILAGSVKNVATASGTSPDPEEPDVPVVPGEDEEPTETQQPSLYVEKTALVEDGYVAKAGDTISYEIKVINNGNVTISGITVSDALTGESWTIEALEPNATQTFTASYVVTEADVVAGSVVNTATASGTDPEGEPTEGTDQEEVPTEDPNGHLTVSKTTTSTPADGTAYQPGEKITYQITVTNDGNLTITNITVTDELTGNTGENAWTIDSLAPGESKTFTAEYTVTETDAATGSVVNNATASGTSPDPSQDGPTVVPGTSTDPTAPLPETETESESESETETETETETEAETETETENETESETAAETESESETTASPQTGDNTPITLYAALMLLATAVITGLTVYRKKTE